MPPTFNSLSFSIDPAWPWSSAGGPWALVLLALVLTALTVWTYRGVRGATRRRVTVLIVLRLAALVVACLAVLRPSLAYQEDRQLPSLLIVAADASQSMSIQDLHDGLSRWDYLRSLLRDCGPELQRLRDEQQVSIAAYRFAGDVSEFDPEGRADGKRT